MKAVVAVVLILVGLPGSSATASWATSAGGASAARAHVMPAGNAPSATASGSSVTVSWAASQFAGGQPAPGYVVRRYDAVSGAAASIRAACTGTVTGLTCTESGVPAGTWRYSVTPAAGTWRGAESAKSAAVTVLL